ncbi:efflux RND transporter periplasmic adaptor subunit [Thiohalocapsa sp.]|uniref:efflux RND transporter periplasmic adaptor subunit n=1 Tax=Thiohalocapsa sp. TaxID=2497641 RepID=UPI0025E64A01|nr:efflux RND transporter periplasmic adaptor subunit [Thiohalocapsa sp.]
MSEALHSAANVSRTRPTSACGLTRRRSAGQQVVLLALLALLTLPGMAQPSGQSGDNPRPAVVVAAVESQAVDKTARFVGNIQAIQSVDLKARVEGFLEDVAFEQGSMVDKGQVLYRIEQDQYEADLEQAQGQLAAAQAEALAAAAALEDKQADFERQAALIEKGDTSQTAFDQAKAARDEAKANVQKAKASEQQAQAGVDNAKINLGYTTIASPIAGRIGATSVTEGNLVSTNTGTLATVAQLDPIRAVFSVPSAELIRLQDKVGAATTAEAREAFVPKLVLPDGTQYDKPGKIAFTDNRVDASTGTVAIYADFPNPSGVLLPGQFITVVVHSEDKEHLPVVPAAAVQRTRTGAQVYLVDGDDRVQLRKVQLGPRVDGGYAVTSGLTDGELVIVSGLQKVKPGMTVQPSGTDGAATGSGSGDAGDKGADGDSGTDAPAGAGSDAGDGADGSADDIGKTEAARGNGG